MTEQHRITIQKTAHYFTIGKASRDIEDFWICCHGYGQLAEHFIRRFEALDDGKTFILAPEGLSRFYTEGLAGKVGASWMTREDRLTEIADYCNYLQTLYDLYLVQLAPEVRVTFFGFSQGCATVTRFAMQHFPLFHRLILYAGMIPEDLDYSAAGDYWENKKLVAVYGNQDPFITAERLQWQKDFFKKQGLNFEEVVFEGGHEVKREVLTGLK